jgi:hypothetical protein
MLKGGDYFVIKKKSFFHVVSKQTQSKFDFSIKSLKTNLLIFFNNQLMLIMN